MSFNRDPINKIYLNNDNAFTLVEIIAVLAILGILASISIPKFFEIGSNAKQKVLRSAISELNSQESMLWSKSIISNEGWIDDETLFLKLNPNLGTEYKWSPNAEIDGGILHFKGMMVKLTRNPSTKTESGRWIITFLSED
jgi:prepilin-type N-terminal cleavage/methylation domain-containing protein